MRGRAREALESGKATPYAAHMIDPRLCAGLLLLAVCSCDKSRNPSGSTSATAPGAVPAGSRGPSKAILARWNPPADATAYAYADLGVLLKTDLFQRMLTSVMLLARAGPAKDAENCITQWSQAVREVAAAGNQQAPYVVVSYDPAVIRMPIGTCVHSLGGWKPTKLANSLQAYESGSNILAFSKGIVVFGSRALIEANLGSRAKAAWPKELLLTKDRQLVFSGKLEQGPIDLRGILAVARKRFTAECDLTFPSEAAAKEVAERASPSKLKERFLADNSFVTPQLGAVFLRNWRVQQKQRTVSLQLRLEGKPEDLAQQVSSIAAAAALSFRMYRADTKAAEPRVRVRAIAERILAAQPKKLISLPPVPAEFERVTAAKYQSSPEDWDAWKPIEFRVSDAQYYQYRVDAAPDGRSAEVIAEGDLNGNGTRSHFSLTITQDPKTQVTSAASEIEERDPLE